MKVFTEPLEELESYLRVQDDLKMGIVPVHIGGCIDSQKSHFMYSLSKKFRSCLVVAANDSKAKEIYEDYRFFDKNACLYPGKDVIFYSADIHGNLILKQRMAIIKRMIEGESLTVVTSIDALMDRILPLDILRQNVIHLNEGEQVSTGILRKKLIQLGFERTEQVEEPGQFAVRGGIIDIFNLSDECPVRIEFWDDEIDSIRSFDVESQRSIERMESLKIYPATEYIFEEKVIKKGLEKIEKEKASYANALRDQAKPEAAAHIEQTVSEFRERLEYAPSSANIDSFAVYFSKDTVSFLDYFFDESDIVFLDEPVRLEEKGKLVELEFNESMSGRLEKGYILPGQAELLYPMKALFHMISKKKTVLISTLDQKVKALPVRARYSITVKSMNSYNSNFEMLTRDLKIWKRNRYRIVLVCGSRTRAERLARDLQEFELNAFYTSDRERLVQKGEIMLVHGNLRRGMEYPEIKFAIISESDIFGEEKKKRKKVKRYSGEKVQSFVDLSVGDYVVHENHGLGIYKGIEKIEIDGVEKDYIKIEYAAGGNLYILATQLDTIQKYAGSDAKKPKLNKLGTQEWTRTKSRVRGAVRELAQDLIDLYAVRQSKDGYAFSQDSLWQKEFEEMFPFEETDDQLSAIESTKRDMESSKIMDRLICGDVGYGKTEIAIRAAFKAVQDGKQVVLLVPTTILAQQHYNTFVQRMKDYPVTIGMLSRFCTKGQQQETLKELKKGMVDILIGTHRVLSKDVEFKNLGLLIVDEEQRFGVTHKEKIKKMKETVDVLTLTATPIPRTLHMSLIGIRDMSVLEEPPVDRLPIQTYVMEFNEELVREAILRELDRGGQVYYVYNRVNTIVEIANMVANLVPDAEVAFAHGRMNERELEQIMYRFINGEIDVLVSTTIIETGLDISNVNTMIIHDADQLGLSQLYQLRGRVGRSSRTAYAFLMYRRNSILKEVAEKRLSAIKEFTDLGSGFKIAMRDLEIRGAGNLLGEQQSGHMEAVGYDLYCKMLNEAVKHVKGEPVEETFETTIDLEVDSYIPSVYIKNEFQKLEIYKRIAAISNEEEYEEMADELMDRYGELPKSAQNLLEIALIKALAHEAGITQLIHKGDLTKIHMYPMAPVKAEKIPELINKYKGAMKFTMAEVPFFTVRFKQMPKQDLLKCEKNVIKDLKTLLD